MPKKKPYNADTAYAYYLRGGTNPKYEAFMVDVPRMSYPYAKKVLKGRWLEAETAILRSPEYSCGYARDVIGGRWDDAELLIQTHPKWARVYAQTVIKGPWKEAETFIMQDIKEARLYRKYALKKGGWGFYLKALALHWGFSLLNFVERRA
jgi:hypothetical protein